ncbi:uncharacterized protein LOC129952004 [Eupeodes corollae]|uniref:uncharacterized protein LOC129952004 n=1 Tax=Eupeodes corollae TaxID=290404 RepID=UPI00248FFDF3|nr:uncharacterized protein LOC129952004 [Eupeodes corollae]
MLTTPLQPHNSLNNITSKNSSSSHRNMKILSLLQKSKPSTHKRQKKKNRKNDIAANVPKAAVMLEVKLQKAMRKNADEKLHSNEDHTQNLLQTKQMLSDILKEYDHISKDKIILTTEIQNMKKYLSEIRSKLDQSLVVLNKNTTLFARKKGLIEKHIFTSKKKSNSLKGKRSKKANISPADQIKPILKNILLL